MICVSASALRTLTEGAARTGEAEDPEVPWPGSGAMGLGGHQARQTG